MTSPTRKLRLVGSKQKPRFPEPVPALKRQPPEPRPSLSEETKLRILFMALKETK